MKRSPFFLLDGIIIAASHRKRKTILLLKSYSGCDDPKKLLVNGWMELHPSENRDSVDKKVRNWLGGRTSSVRKKDAFQLSLLMDLPLDKTDAFLKQVCGDGIHWRDPEEIIWGYGILHQKSYAGICAMLEQYNAIAKPAVTEEAPDVYTAEVKAKLEPVLSQSDTGIPGYIPLPHWLPKVTGSFYCVKDAGTGKTRLVEAGEAITQPPSACYISCVEVSRETVDAYIKALSESGYAVCP